MIELRWVVGYEPAPEYGPDTLKAVKVLQYRTTLQDWQAVPTVTAEEAEK